MDWCSCVSLLFSRGLTAVERRDSWDGRVHLLAGNFRPGEQRLRQLLHQTGALSSISHHRASPHCQQHWKNPSQSDAHEAWKKTQWLPLTPGLSLFVFLFLYRFEKLEERTSQSLIRERRMCIRGDLVWNGDTVFFFFFLSWLFVEAICPMDFFSSVFIVLEVFFTFFQSLYPLLVRRKKKVLGGKISVPCVFLALFHLFWMGVHLVRVVKIYIETVYSYMYDIHIKHTHI